MEEFIYTGKDNIVECTNITYMCKLPNNYFKAMILMMFSEMRLRESNNKMKIQDTVLAKHQTYIYKYIYK